jgi:predicted nucleotidyltransferase
VGTISIGIFGSPGRSAMTEPSDIDVVVELHDSDMFGLNDIK